MRYIFFAFIISSTFPLHAQPLKEKQYSIENIALPAELHNQVSISGLNFFNNQLYLVSERCPEIFIIDQRNGSVIKKISLNVPQEFEMEAMTSYKGKLYLVSENKAAVYEVTPETGILKIIRTSEILPPKSKNGDGMEGIASNENQGKFYLLRERTEDRTTSQIYTFNISKDADGSLMLLYESVLDIPLENTQWRYSDICYDAANSRLICLKSYSKGKTRQQYLESIKIDNKGNLLPDSRDNVSVENFSSISSRYKEDHYSMNLEGITIDANGNFYITSDNTSGKADCSAPAKEKTILLKLNKK